MKINSTRIIWNLAKCIAAFALTVAFAIFWKWQATDLIWGIWLSSLCVGSALIVTPIVSSVLRSRGTIPFGLAARCGVSLVGFNIFVFCLAHFFIGICFYYLFPPAGVPESRLPNTEDASLILLIVLKYPVKILLIILKLYWPVVLATALSRFDEFRAAVVTKADISVDRVRNNTGGDPWGKPYGSVARMLILMIVLGNLQSHVSLTHAALYVVLLFYFFPWAALDKMLIPSGSDLESRK
jgi:hypothetical protein